MILYCRVFLLVFGPLYLCGSVACKATTADNDIFQEILTTVNDIKLRELHTQKELNALRVELAEHGKTVNELKDFVKEQAREIADLKSLNQVLNSAIVDIESLDQTSEDNTQLKQSPDEIQRSLHALHDDKFGNTDESYHLREADVSFSKKEAVTEKPSIRLRNTLEQGVAFFATLGNDVQHLGHNQNVVFEKVITNTGNAYNPHLGAFVAPVAGTYVFSTTITTFNDHVSDYGIFRNGVQLTVLWVDGASSHYISTSDTVVLQLAAGEDVEVRCLFTDHAVHGSNHSMFSGFLLRESQPDVNIVG